MVVCTQVVSLSGSPVRITRSASLPTSIEPASASAFKSFAGRSVIASSASANGVPYFTAVAAWYHKKLVPSVGGAFRLGFRVVAWLLRFLGRLGALIAVGRRPRRLGLPLVRGHLGLVVLVLQEVAGGVELSSQRCQMAHPAATLRGTQ